MDKPIRTKLGEVRRSRGVRASDLARLVGISRQTVYAIESGTYVPNTEVSLRLARELGVSVEDLFALEPGRAETVSECQPDDVLSASPLSAGQPVRVGCIGADERYVCAPVHPTPYYLPEADAVVEFRGKRAGLALLSDEDLTRRLVVAGCDPAISLLARMVERMSGTEVVTAPATSKLALTWLREGKIHIAGTHLKDFRSGEFNVPMIRREVPGDDSEVVTFAYWEEGLVTAPGNPRHITSVDDLVRLRGKVRFLNREPGSGSRALLDDLLSKAGIAAEQVHGYLKTAPGHLAAASAVRSGEADCCVATASAARAFGLHFIPLQLERYDFAIPRRLLALPAVQQFLEALQRSALRKKLEILAGYDTSHTGNVVSEGLRVTQ